MLSPYFSFNLSFFAFTTMPEKFSPHLIFVLEDSLNTMLVRRHQSRVWN